MLGRLATTPCLFEPFRNAATPNEICSCLLKLLEVRGEFQRQANRNSTRVIETNLPRLWILTPTASASILEGFGAFGEENWPRGIYFLPAYLRTAIIAIHQLPKVTKTLWLRILGKGTVQQQVIDELEALPEAIPFRANALELLFNLRVNLEVSSNLEQEDRELIMRLSPLYQQRLLEATQIGVEQGREQGREQGIEQGQRLVVENLLKARFGLLDEELLAIVNSLLALPPEEYIALLLQLSREELLTRLNSGFQPEA